MKHNVIKKFSYQAVLLAAAALLSGCSLTAKNDLHQAWLKPGVQVKLPEPKTVVPIKRQQYLTVTVNGQSDSLLTMLDAENDRLTLAGLSPLGIRLFKVSYSADAVDVEQSIVLPQLPPINQVVADIMLSYWPVNDWRPLLPQGWSLNDEENKRLLRDDSNQIVTEINYRTQDGQREPISIAQYAFHYHISILNVDNQ
jgi:hypothetical protein